MADADPAGTSSTPSTAASSTTADPAAATSSSTQATTTTDPATAVAATTTTEPAKAAPVVDPATFTLPEDVKFNPEAVSSLQEALKGKVVDGKLNLTAQDVADMLAAQGRTGLARWQKQQADQDQAYEATTKQRFTAAELARAEAGVGFLTARQLAIAEKAGWKDVVPFRELAKGFLNHPDFVAVMRIVGDSLNEDTFEQGNNVLVKGKKSIAERMYPTAKPS